MSARDGDGRLVWLEHAYDERCRELTALQDLHESVMATAHRLRDERDALLAALKGILAGRPELWGDSVVNGRLALKIDEEAVDAADAAIAKAEGR